MSEDARFGELRSLMNQAALDQVGGERLRELLHAEHAEHPQRHQALWVPYMAQFPHHFDAPLWLVRSAEELAHALVLAPAARFRLSARYPGASMEEVEAIVTSPALRAVSELHIEHLGLGPNVARVLARSPHLARLQTLSLNGNLIGASGCEALGAAHTMRALSRLELFGNQIGDEGLFTLLDAPFTSSLTSLDLEGNQIGEAGARALASCDTLSTLRQLYLANNPLGASGVAALCEARSGLRAVEVLDLDSCNVTPEAMGPLARWPHAEKLRELWLGSNEIGAEGMRALAGSTRFGALTRLDLRACEFDDEALGALADSSAFGSLRALLLGYNGRILGGGISAKGVAALVRAPLAGQLLELDLSHCDLEDEAAEVLASAPRLTGLHKLELERNTFTARGWQALASSPHLNERLRSRFTAELAVWRATHE